MKTFKEVIRKLRHLCRDVKDEIEVNTLLIRNELRKERIDKSKILTYLIAIEEATD